MKKRTTLINYGIFALAGVALIAHALYFYPFFSDDGFISLRYSKRFAEGLGLTWTDGERVEGYTNLLWVLLNGILGAIISDFPLAARFWGLIGALTAIFFVSLAPGGRVGIDRTRVLTGGWMLALSTPLAVWSIGGLEQAFLAGMLSGALHFLLRALDDDVPNRRHLLIAGLFFGLVAITRADSILFFVAAAFGVLLSRGLSKPTIRALLMLSLLPALFFGAQLLFRLIYYGEWVPNTALVKVSFNFVRFKTGLLYVTGAVPVTAVLLAAGLWGALLMHSIGRRHRALIPLTVFAVWIGYIAVVGGDIFRAWRHIVPALVPLAYLVSGGAFTLKPWLSKRRGAAAMGIGVMLILHVLVQITDEKSQGVKTKDHWEWRARSAGEMLKTVFGREKPLLAVDAAGSLPFWSELPSLDMLGLNDKYLVRHPPKWFGVRGIGHELGDGKYVLKRHPDILVFNSALGSRKPHWPSGRQLSRMRPFKTGYRFVKTRAPGGARLRMYIKLEDSRIGVERLKGEVRIPGYFFSGSQKAQAARLRKNRLVLAVNPPHPGRLDNLRLARGTWRVTVKHPISPSGIFVTCANGEPARVIGKPSPASGAVYAVRLDRQQALDIVLRPPKKTLVDEVVLERVPDRGATHICRATGKR